MPLHEKQASNVESLDSDSPHQMFALNAPWCVPSSQNDEDLLIRRPKDLIPFLIDYKAIMGTVSYSGHYFVKSLSPRSIFFYCVIVCSSSREGSKWVFF